MKKNYSNTDVSQQNPQIGLFSHRKTNFNVSMNLPTMSQQSKKRSFVIQSKNIKTRSKQSFEKQLNEISAFNAYIDKQYSKMLQQKSQNPTLMIPSGFKKFVHSKLFQNLIQKIYDYMDILIQYDKKYENIQILTSKFEYTQRYEPGLKKMRFQTNHLQQKCKQISYIYMGILLSHGESKMIFKDQYFFQTMIYFIAQILKSVIQQEDYALVEQQLNRIFRTNAFNLIKRRHDEDNIFQKYPALKQAKYDPSVFGLSKIIRRLSIQKRFNYSMQIKDENTDKIKKPLQINLSSFGSVRSRSPLISSFYPSSKQKLYEFGKSARDKESLIKQARASNTFFYKR